MNGTRKHHDLQSDGRDLLAPTIKLININLLRRATRRTKVFAKETTKAKNPTPKTSVRTTRSTKAKVHVARTTVPVTRPKTKTTLKK